MRIGLKGGRQSLVRRFWKEIAIWKRNGQDCLQWNANGGRSNRGRIALSLAEPVVTRRIAPSFLNFSHTKSLTHKSHIQTINFEGFHIYSFHNRFKYNTV